jgi:hypothetical protein
VSVDGNSGRNLLRGPTFKDVDLAISRDFNFKERFRLQARADAYNVFNLVSLSTPAGNTITCCATPSSIPAGTFGRILTANPMRQLQLGLKLSF